MDPLGLKKKSARRVQAELTMMLRTYTSLSSTIVCNQGIHTSAEYPLDNILVYTLPSDPQAESIPKLILHGSALYNEPYARQSKPKNLDPQQLETLCMQDISQSPTVLKHSPYIPTLPRLHTLQLRMRTHDETPFVSSGSALNSRVDTLLSPWRSASTLSALRSRVHQRPYVQTVVG